jgi:GNAT superfamily N-acetyltransferase
VQKQLSINATALTGIDTCVRKAVIRAMRADDMSGTFRIRTSVTENALTLEQLERMGITPANVAASLKGRARGWVAEEEGVVVAFAIADGETRSIFALFVARGYEGRGLGRALLDRAVRWLQSESSGAIWLTTAPDTRAAALYVRRGFAVTGREPDGSLRLELKSCGNEP